MTPDEVMQKNIFFNTEAQKFIVDKLKELSNTQGNRVADNEFNTLVNCAKFDGKMELIDDLITYIKN